MKDSNDLNGLRLVAYLRDSGGANQELSIAEQEKSIGEWAKRNAVIISRVYKDEARSGRHLTGRDSFIDMMDYMDGTTPEVGLVLWEYSRLSRDYDDSQYYLSDLRRKGYRILSLNDDIPESLDGRLLEAVTTWKNARYIEDLSKNVKRGMRYVAHVHHAWFGGKAPIGYIRIEKNIGMRRDGTIHKIRYLNLDPATAPIVRQCFELRAAGATYREIHEAAHLFSWVQSYKFLLDNEVYTGTYHGIENFCPPIVDEQLWNAVQESNIERRNRQGYNHPRAVRSRYLLSGLLKCGKCGSPMRGTNINSHGNHIFYYFCTGSSRTDDKCVSQYIRKDTIEPLVINAIKSLLLDEMMLDKIYQEAVIQASHVNNEQQILMEQMKGKLDSIDKQIANFINAIKEAGHSPAMIKELAALEDNKNSLEAEMHRLNRPAQIPDVDISKLTHFIHDELENAEDVKLLLLIRSIVTEVRAVKDGKLSGVVECRLQELSDRPIFISL